MAKEVTQNNAGGAGAAPAPSQAEIDQAKQVAEKPSPDFSYQESITVTLQKPIEVSRGGDVEVKELVMVPPTAKFYFETGDHIRDMATTMPNGEQAFMPQRLMGQVRKYICHMATFKLPDGNEGRLSDNDLEDLSFYDVKQLEKAFDQLIEPF